jgi:hypothetical protein
MHPRCTVPVCLQIASSGSAESIVLSVGGAESIILSAFGAKRLMLSVCAESMIVSAPPAETMILSAPFDSVIMLTAVQQVATKQTTICNTDDHLFTTVVNSTSMAAPIGLPPKMAEFCHSSSRLLVGHQRRCALWWL